MSVYDIADHPDFRFRTTDIVIRIGNTEDGALPKEDEVCTPSSSSHSCPPVQQLQCLVVPPGGSGRPDLQSSGSSQAAPPPQHPHQECLPQRPSPLWVLG